MAANPDLDSWRISGAELARRAEATARLLEDAGVSAAVLGAVLDLLLEPPPVVIRKKVTGYKGRVPGTPNRKPIVGQTMLDTIERRLNAVYQLCAFAAEDMEVIAHVLLPEQWSRPSGLAPTAARRCGSTWRTTTR